MRQFLLLLLFVLLAPTIVSAQDEQLLGSADGATAFVDTVDADKDDVDTISVDSAFVDKSANDTLPWPYNVRTALDVLLTNSMFETSQVGLMVYDLTADSTIYSKNERQLMRPASTMKLVTAIAAIDRLGGSYQLRTSLYYNGKIENRTLTGDVYCMGGFDPRFNSDDMNAFVESLRGMGVDTIRGRIIADKSMKDASLLGEGWCWDDDNPVLSPLLISRKDNFVERFVDELREAGVVVEAFNSEGEVPQEAHCVCTRSHTIDQILMRMMKDSDNLYAEAMFYQVASAVGGRPAHASHARSAIKSVIGKAGGNASMCKVADGSGLSLYNYVSAELETKLLRYAYRNSNIYLHLYPSLPIAGEDGTLSRRMRGTHAAGNVRAKTGTLTGVYSLAGYCTAANGHVLCFSILNQGVLHASNGRAFQDRVCSVLCRP